jgi:hypothetical protein
MNDRRLGSRFIVVSLVAAPKHPDWWFPAQSPSWPARMKDQSAMRRIRAAQRSRTGRILSRLGEKHDDDALNPDIVPAGELVGIFGRVEQGDGERCWVAPGLARHLLEFPDNVGHARPGAKHRAPAVAIADGAAYGLRETAADQARRVGLLPWLGPGYHLGKIDHVAVIFILDSVQISFIASIRSRISSKAGLEHGAVVLHFILVPAAANTEQKMAVRHLIDRGEELGRLDRVALLDQGQK